MADTAMGLAKAIGGKLQQAKAAMEELEDVALQLGWTMAEVTQLYEDRSRFAMFRGTRIQESLEARLREVDLTLDSVANDTSTKCGKVKLALLSVVPLPCGKSAKAYSGDLQKLQKRLRLVLDLAGKETSQAMFAVLDSQGGGAAQKQISGGGAQQFWRMMFQNEQEIGWQRFKEKLLVLYGEDMEQLFGSQGGAMVGGVHSVLHALQQTLDVMQDGSVSVNEYASFFRPFCYPRPLTSVTDNDLLTILERNVTSYQGFPAERLTASVTTGHTHTVSAVALHNNRLFTADESGTLKVWLLRSVRDGKRFLDRPSLLYTIPCTSACIQSVSPFHMVHAGGLVSLAVLVSSANGRCRVVDCANGSMVARAKPSEMSIDFTAVIDPGSAASPGLFVTAAGFPSRAASVYSFKPSEVQGLPDISRALVDLHGHSARVTAFFVLSSEHGCIATASADTSIIVHSIVKDAQVATLRAPRDEGGKGISGHLSTIGAVMFQRDESTPGSLWRGSCWSASYEGRIVRWHPLQLDFNDLPAEGVEVQPQSNLTLAKLWEKRGCLRGFSNAPVLIGTGSGDDLVVLLFAAENRRADSGLMAVTAVCYDVTMAGSATGSETAVAAENGSVAVDQSSYQGANAVHTSAQAAPCGTRGQMVICIGNLVHLLKWVIDEHSRAKVRFVPQAVIGGQSVWTGHTTNYFRRGPLHVTPGRYTDGCLGAVWKPADLPFPVLVTACRGTEIRFWDPSTGRLLHKVELGEPIRDVLQGLMHKEEMPNKEEVRGAAGRLLKRVGVGTHSEWSDADTADYITIRDAIREALNNAKRFADLSEERNLLESWQAMRHYRTWVKQESGSRVTLSGEVSSLYVSGDELWIGTLDGQVCRFVLSLQAEGARAKAREELKKFGYEVPEHLSNLQDEQWQQYSVSIHKQWEERGAPDGVEYDVDDAQEALDALRQHPGISVRCKGSHRLYLPDCLGLNWGWAGSSAPMLPVDKCSEVTCGATLGSDERLLYIRDPGAQPRPLCQKHWHQKRDEHEAEHGRMDLRCFVCGFPRPNREYPVCNSCYDGIKNDTSVAVLHIVVGRHSAFAGICRRGDLEYWGRSRGYVVKVWDGKAESGLVQYNKLGDSWKLPQAVDARRSLSLGPVWDYGNGNERIEILDRDGAPRGLVLSSGTQYFRRDLNVGAVVVNLSAVEVSEDDWVKLPHGDTVGSCTAEWTGEPGAEWNIITGGFDYCVREWKVAKELRGQPQCHRLYSRGGHSEGVTVIALSEMTTPAGDTFSLLVSGAQDGEILIWNRANQSVMRTLLGHHRRVQCLRGARSLSSVSASDARSPWTDTHMVSVADDRTIGVWDIEEIFRTFQADGAAVAYPQRVEDIAHARSRVLASLASDDDDASPPPDPHVPEHAQQQ
eukprot:TRINITY_DN21393_c0_g1_i1.p1 TRINITY_DN21393_c0_g1~~TRINITY_DN21393_c0_g1_i1.p1  ORF type:complete len:1414 (+),score=365.72 TRINITY_DN21393_c0_g1_i1:57-4244(+)